MKLKITVRTPKNQAAKCIESQKRALLGFAQAKLVKEQKLVNDHKFYWILEVDGEKDRQKIIKKCAAGEVLIKRFYSALFHIIGKANKLSEKFDKGLAWIRRFLIKRLSKRSQQSTTGKENEMIESVRNMSDHELREFIKIHDKEAMQKLLAGELITIEEMKKG